jgi:hypothetical protein
MSVIQQAINFLYRHPKSKIKQIGRYGGFIKYYKIEKKIAEMQTTSLGLSPIQCHSEGLPIYFLTGKKHFHQTLFCILSLVKKCGDIFCFYLVDDGTFDIKLKNRINQQLPGSVIITKEEINLQIENLFHLDKYPTLIHKRTVYPHIKKLTDIHSHLNGPEWKLVLDSDMLFRNKPTLLLNWLKNPDKPLHMVDCQESYGYSKSLMASLSGSAIPSLVNVGTIGLRSKSIRWPDLEVWIAELEALEGSSYYLEQALSAMLIGEQHSTVLPANDYVVNPSSLEVDQIKGVLHHYVDLSKGSYYNKMWQKVIGND